MGGRTLVVESLERVGQQSILTLPGGGTIYVEARRIRAVSELEQEAPAIESALPVVSRPTDPPLEDLLMNIEVTGGFTELIGAAAVSHGVDPELLRCVLLVESAFDPRAVSPKGAMGLAQLMPGTAEELGVKDPFDPEQAVDAAARLLGRLLRENEGRFVPALAAYNAGRGAVRRYGGVPPYRETVQYIEKILSLYHASPLP